MLDIKMVAVSDSQMFTKQVEFFEEATRGKKALRSEEVVVKTVVVDNLEFNADEKSLDRISRVVTLANWKFNELILTSDFTNAYALVYLNTLVPWKLATNNIAQVSVEQLCRAQELAINNLNEIWVKYS